MEDDKSIQYRKMLAYLESLGADLVGHDQVFLTKAANISFSEMNPDSLLHYQRVLEATIDNRDDQLMDREAMKEDLVEVVRERFHRGAVKDKTTEAKEFRTRLASLN